VTNFSLITNIPPLPHPDLKADYILANPPFNQKEWGVDILQEDGRWKYGTPPNGNANFAWMQHMLYHLSPKGVMETVYRHLLHRVCLHIAQGLIHGCVFVSLAGWQICKNLFRFGSFRLCASCDSLKLGLAYGHKEQYTNHKHCK
jgi:hypothetical protein